MSSDQDNTARLHKFGWVAIVGPTNAGKSTLLNALLGEKVSIVSPKPQTTRNRILGLLTRENAQLAFLDTPGVLREKKRDSLGAFFDQALKEAASTADVRLLVLDAARLARRGDELQKLESMCQAAWLKQVQVIALNKVDELDKAELLPLIQRLAEIFNGPSGVDFVPISALKGDGLLELERVLIRRLPEGPAMFPEEMLSDQSESFFIGEIVREKMFRHLQQELPYSAAVIVERREELKRGIGIDAVIVVERDSQKGIVIGKGGQMLKQIGIDARRELEQHFECQVTLRLHVRVEENWTSDPQRMRRVGYGV